MMARACYVPPPSGAQISAGRGSRVALSPTTHKRLKNFASKRMRGPGSVSKLGSIVLDNYLGHMERVYFGRARTLACVEIPAEKRDIDAVIFDMDGVLCDSEHVSRVVGTAVFEQLYNLKVKPEDFAPFTGTGEAAFLEGVARVHDVSGFDVDEAKRCFFELYVSGGYTLQLKAFTGIPGLISRVAQLGLKVGVASAADAVKVDANLNAIGLPRDTFDFVTSSDDIERKKPAPDVFLAAARGLGVEPNRCVVVEDAVAGVQAALAAGMRCVAVATSLDAEALSAAGAHIVRDQPAFIELADLFGSDVFADSDNDDEPGTEIDQTVDSNFDMDIEAVITPATSSTTNPSPPSTA